MMVVRSLAAAAAVVLLACPAAWAGRIYFNAAAAEDLRSGSPSCEAVVVSSATAGQHSFVERRCDRSTEEGMVFHFMKPSDMIGVTFSASVIWQSPSVGSVCWAFTAFCSNPTDLWTNHTAFPPFQANVGGSFSPNVLFTTNLGSAAHSGGGATDSMCVVKVTRDLGNGVCPDDLVADAALLGFVLVY